MDPLVVVGWTVEIFSLLMLPVFGGAASQESPNHCEHQHRQFVKSCAEGNRIASAADGAARKDHEIPAAGPRGFSGRFCNQEEW